MGGEQGSEGPVRDSGGCEHATSGSRLEKSSSSRPSSAARAGPLARTVPSGRGCNGAVSWRGASRANVPIESMGKNSGVGVDLRRRVYSRALDRGSRAGISISGLALSRNEGRRESERDRDPCRGYDVVATIAVARITRRPDKVSLRPDSSTVPIRRGQSERAREVD
jgi:hypothetical protein